jgi:hypothetical protein
LDKFLFMFNVVTRIRRLAQTAVHDLSSKFQAEIRPPAKLFDAIVDFFRYVFPARVTQELYHLSTFLSGFPGDPMH